MAIPSLSASEPSSWSFGFEGNSYKVHSYVLLWFLNAKKTKSVLTSDNRKCSQQGFPFYRQHSWSLEKSKVQAGRLPVKGEATSYPLAKSSFWLHVRVPGV